MIDHALKGVDIADRNFQEVKGRRLKDLRSGDLVTDIDSEIERLILAGLAADWPTFSASGEEFGRTAPHNDVGGRWELVIDPLDGTNNYAVGLPNYAVALTLTLWGSPALSVIAQGLTRSIAVTSVDKKILINGRKPRAALRGLRIRSSLWLGYGLATDEGLVPAARLALSTLSDRVFESWCPSGDVLIALAGGIQLVLGLGCSGSELPAALHFFRQMDWTVIMISNPTTGKLPVSFIAYDPSATREGKDLLLRTREWRLRWDTLEKY